MSFFRAFKLERFFAKHAFSVTHPLCSSDCESISIADLLAMEPGSEERLLQTRLVYTKPRGATELLESLAHQSPQTEPDNYFIHVGAEEAILNLFLATINAGDRIVVNSPTYESLAEIPRALGAEVINWNWRQTSTDGKCRWTLDPDELPGLSGGKAKFIIINTPHNPTGGHLTREEMDATIAYARQTGAVILSDEVYRRLEHAPHRLLPPVWHLYENGISLDVLSKHSGLPGLRIGWLASQRQDILEKVAVIKDYNSICASAPSELLAAIAVRNMDKIVARNQKIVKRNLLLLNEFFTRHSDFAQWCQPEGSSIAFPCLTSGEDAEPLIEKIIREAGVLLLPGSCYGYKPSYFRVGYGRANMPEALAQLEKWL